MVLTTTEYSLSVRTRRPLAEVEAAVRDALKREGFGVLTEIDLQAAFREKLGRETAPYRILGACNPELAFRAWSADPEVGTLLPCNVAIYAAGDWVVVSAVDPEAMLGLLRAPEIEEVARDARTRLTRVLEAVGGR
jgi:uncharacterized protein (DUF302 family)